jgi:type VI secretion system protein ImpH
MRPAYRHGSLDLTRWVLEAPQAFEFYQAMRILGRMSSNIRFRNSVSLSYPVGDIESIRVVRAGRPVHDVDEALGVLGEPDVEVVVTQGFMGLLGTFGALPTGYTEWVSAGDTMRREGPARAFLNVLSQRAIMQFYEAWRYQHPVLGHETAAESDLTRIACALAGHGLLDQADRGQKPQALTASALASFCGALRERPVSAPYLGRLLSRYLDEPVRVEDFVGAWYVLPSELFSRLGSASASLGANTILGGRSWQRNLRVSLHVGPLRIERYLTFLSGGKVAGDIYALLAEVAGDAFEFEVVPLLHQCDVIALQLGNQRLGGLGRDAFLATQPSSAHRSDARFLLSSDKDFHA